MHRVCSRARCCPPRGATGPTGPAGTPGATGPTGPAGTPSPSPLAFAAIGLVPSLETPVFVMTDVPQYPTFTPVTDPAFVVIDAAEFTHAAGILTYTGTTPRVFQAVATLSDIVSDVESMPPGDLVLGFFVNGTLYHPAAIGVGTATDTETLQVVATTMIFLNPGDTVQLAVSLSGLEANPDIGVVSATLSLG